MVQYSRLDREMETKDHLKNGASMEYQTSGENFRITQKFSKLSKMAMLVIMAIFIERIANAQTEPNSQQVEQPILFISNIKSLEEAIKPMLGKKIYIDIWATWCKPCIMEFAHNEALKKILAENDVQQLYISLDYDSNDKNWKDYVKKYNLTGTHIRASGEFSSDILKLFFNAGKMVSIPRYILIDEEGNVMKNNAKRPSQLVAGEKLW